MSYPKAIQILDGLEQGKEFEAIIEAILLRSGIFFDNQGVIGSKLFETERLGKLVDCVVPELSNIVWKKGNVL